MKTITFYSYKGGVGRTLALANIATRLSEFNKKVCIIDFDLEAPGVHYKFSPNLQIENRKGIVDYIHEYVVTKERPENFKDIYFTIPTSNRNNTPITFIPAGDITKRNYWSNLANINWNELLYKEDGVLFLLDLKERIKNEIKPDFLLIDSRTGITEIAGVTISLLADHVIVLAANNSENLFGSKQLLDSISDPARNIFNRTIQSTFALTRIPFLSNEPSLDYDQHKGLLLNAAIKVFNDPNRLDEILIIHSDDALLLKESLKINIFLDESESSQNNKTNKSSITQDYLKLFEVLTKNYLTQEEVISFNKIKKAESLLNKVYTTDDYEQKLFYINEAILLNDKYLQAYILKGEVLINNLKNFYINDSVIKEIQICIEKIFKIDLDNVNGIKIKILLLNRLIYKNDIQSSQELLQLCDKIIAFDPKEPNAYMLKAYTLERIGQYENAIALNNKVLEMIPNNSNVYNSIANLLRKIYPEKAFEYIYRAISLNPREWVYYSTLAEIYATVGNKNEFYKNFELALMMYPNLEYIILDEYDVYKPFLEEERFINLLKKYNKDVDLIKKIIEDFDLNKKFSETDMH